MLFRNFKRETVFYADIKVITIKGLSTDHKKEHFNYLLLTNLLLYTLLVNDYKVRYYNIYNSNKHKQLSILQIDKYGGTPLSIYICVIMYAMYIQTDLY